MKISVSFFSRATLGLGLAASLFLGCEQFLGQSDADKAKSDDKVTTAPEDVALNLSIKETEDCKALRDQVVAAHAAGQAPGALETEFIGKCIVEVKPSAGAADAKITLPADLVPDDLTRCRWIVSQIEGGREELIIKFRYYCPDDCDTLAVRDSIRHVKLCRDPDPTTDCAALKRKLALMDTSSEEYYRLQRFHYQQCVLVDTTRIPKDTIRIPGDTIRNPKDTLIDRAYCDSLRHYLAMVKADSEAYKRALRELAAFCGGDKPVDTIPRPGISFCDSLRKQLSILDPASEAYAQHKAMYSLKCVVRDTLDSIPVPTRCDSLRKLLGALKPETEEYARVKKMLYEACAIPVDTIKVPRDTVVIPKPGITYCDSLLKRLNTSGLTNEEYARLKQAYSEKCMVPRDTVKVPVDTTKVAPTECEQILAKLKLLDPASPDYLRLKTYYGERCAVVTPVEPKPMPDPIVDPKPISNCESYKLKLASVPPDSRDYAYLKDLIAKECVDILPAK